MSRPGSHLPPPGNRGGNSSGGRFGSTLARVLGGIVAFGLLITGLFLGAFVLTIMLAVGVILAVGVRVWLWWRMRNGDSMEDILRGRFSSAQTGPRRQGPSRPPAPERREGDTVDGEFEVLDGDERD